MLHGPPSGDARKGDDEKYCEAVPDGKINNPVDH
jgi:hypothetical protein